MMIAIFHVESIDTRRDFQRAPTIMTMLPAPTLKGLRRAVKVLNALTPYLPAGLMARLASSPQGMMQEGEHRLVAVTFANVHGLGELVDRLGPGREEEIVNALNQYFVGMDNAVHGLGGVINKMDLAEHGDKLLAFFGAPVAHEDDAERAVRAALNMQAALREMSSALPEQVGLPDLKLTQQVGISLGYVFAGYVGTAWRREYTVMGDEVNLAARLMAAAEPGSIIVSGAAQRKVQALFNLTPRGEVRVKGKSRSGHDFSGGRPARDHRPVARPGRLAFGTGGTRRRMAATLNCRAAIAIGARADRVDHRRSGTGEIAAGGRTARGPAGGGLNPDPIGGALVRRPLCLVLRIGELPAHAGTHRADDRVAIRRRHCGSVEQIAHGGRGVAFSRERAQPACRIWRTFWGCRCPTRCKRRCVTSTPRRCSAAPSSPSAR